eukprot:1660351-Amphidinium_carterae.2
MASTVQLPKRSSPAARGCGALSFGPAGCPAGHAFHDVATGSIFLCEHAETSSTACQQQAGLPQSNLSDSVLLVVRDDDPVKLLQLLDVRMCMLKCSSAVDCKE